MAVRHKKGEMQLDTGYLCSWVSKESAFTIKF